MLTLIAMPLALTMAMVPARVKDGGPTGAFTYSTDAATAATQRHVKQVAKRYQTALNSGDFAKIMTLFAPARSPSGTAP